MKLEYLNFSSVKKFARGNGKRVSTSFVQALDAHCTKLLDQSLVCAKDTTTLAGEHVAAAAQQIK